MIEGINTFFKFPKLNDKRIQRVVGISVFRIPLFELCLLSTNLVFSLIISSFGIGSIVTNINIKVIPLKLRLADHRVAPASVSLIRRASLIFNANCSNCLHPQAASVEFWKLVEFKLCLVVTFFNRRVWKDRNGSKM